MSDANDIDKAEFESLRAEILFHQTNASAIFGLNIVGLGVGVTASSLVNEILLLLAVLSCVLWSRYTDHLTSLFRIASYIELDLRPRVVARVGEPVLGWESFLRTRTALVEGPSQRQLSPDSRIGIIFASIAFSLPPPLLCAVYVLQRWPISTTTGWVGTSALILIVLAFWVYVITRTVGVARWILAIDGRITQSALSAVNNVGQDATIGDSGQPNR